MIKLTAKDVRAALRAYFGDGAYAVLEEVSDAAGFDRSRSADMITMGLWPSRGLMLEGIEIKVSRADWLSELKDPSKAETFFRYCDRWWIATSDASLVHEGELPEPWGHLTVANGKIKVVKPAPKLAPQPLERGFLAAMLKRATNLTPATLDSMLTERLEIRLAQRRDDDRYRIARLETELGSLRETVHAFEKATGLHVGSLPREHVAIFNLMKNLADFKVPGTVDIADRLEAMDNTLAQTLHGIRTLKNAYEPILRQFEAVQIAQLPEIVPTSLVSLDPYGSSVSNLQGLGHVFTVAHTELIREKVKASRGFFRVWEPALVGAARSRGTKRRPSVRYASDGVPRYCLELRHASAIPRGAELVYTETPSAAPEWDVAVLLPKDWNPSLDRARVLPLIIDVDERPHQMWAVRVNMDTPMEHLGAWVMGGEIPTPT